MNKIEERRIFLATIGFDEKFVIRGLIKYGCYVKDKLILIYPAGKVYPENEKMEKAKKNLTYYLSEYIGIDVEEHPVKLPLEEDFTENLLDEAVRLAKKIISEVINYDRIVYLLSGGMRTLLLLSILSARILIMKLKGINIDLYLEAENGIGYVRFPMLLFFFSPLSEKLVRILSIIIDNPGIGGKELLEITGVSKASLYRMLNELENEGFIYKDKRKYYPSELGKYVAKFFR